VGQGFRKDGIRRVLKFYASYAVEALLSIVFPRACRLCNRLLPFSYPPPVLSVCDECSQTLSFAFEPFCQKCGLPLDFPSQVCGDCIQGDLQFDKARALFIYGGGAVSLLMSLKYGGRFDLAHELGRMLAWAALKNGMTQNDIVLPVPISIERHIKRGYNQSALLAKTVAKTLKIPFSPSVLYRQKDPGPQDHHTRSERLRRQKGCFAVRNAEVIRNKRILLVDDVITTGATASECARVLKRSGASTVEVLVVCRAVGR